MALKKKKFIIYYYFYQSVDYHNMQTKCDLIDKIKNQFYDHLKMDHSILQPIKQRQLIFKFWKENEDNSWYMVSNVDQSMRPMCRTCFQLITNAALGYYLSKLPNLNDTNQLIDQFPMIWKSCNKNCTCIVVDLPALSVARLDFVDKIPVENHDDLADSDTN